MMKKPVPKPEPSAGEKAMDQTKHRTTDALNQWLPVAPPFVKLEDKL